MSFTILSVLVSVICVVCESCGMQAWIIELITSARFVIAVINIFVRFPRNIQQERTLVLELVFWIGAVASSITILMYLL